MSEGNPTKIPREESERIAREQGVHERDREPFPQNLFTTRPSGRLREYFAYRKFHDLWEE